MATVFFLNPKAFEMGILMVDNINGELAAMLNGAGAETRIFSEVVPDPSIEVVAKAIRSEERRVGKECRSRWSPYH